MLKSAFKGLPKKAKTAATVVGGLGAGMVLAGFATSAAGRVAMISTFKAKGKWQRIGTDALIGLLAVGLVAGLAGRRGKRGSMIKMAAPLLAGGALYAAAKPEIDDLIARGTSSVAGFLPSGAAAPGGTLRLAAARAVGGQAARQGSVAAFSGMNNNRQRRLSVLG